MLQSGNSLADTWAFWVSKRHRKYDRKYVRKLWGVSALLPRKMCTIASRWALRTHEQNQNVGQSMSNKTVLVHNAAATKIVQAENNPVDLQAAIMPSQ